MRNDRSLSSKCLTVIWLSVALMSVSTGQVQGRVRGRLHARLSPHSGPTATAGARASAERVLGVEERIYWQTRIEEVQYRARIAASPDAARVPFDEAVPADTIRGKVEDTLRRTDALERFWQEPITDAQLQAEIDRMTAQTKQPELLIQLFAALNNDPNLVAECLARPQLAERFVRSKFAYDGRIHEGVRD